MMRRLFAGVVLLAAACGPTNATYRDLDQLGSDYARGGAVPFAEDTCHMADHRNMIGVAEAAIDRSSLPPNTRILCFDCALPVQDTPTRLNLQLGADRKVSGLRCG